MIRRIFLVALTLLLTGLPDVASAQCAGVTARPFKPGMVVRFYISPVWESNPLLYECIRQGMELWNGPNTAVQWTGSASAANMSVWPIEPEHFPYPTAPNGEWNLYSERRDADNYVIEGQIVIATNIEQAAGFNEEGGCNRVKKLVAHELGHGYFGSMPGVHQLGSIMQEGNPFAQWGNLDALPLGPTDCDRRQEQFGRSFVGQMAADIVGDCYGGAYQDSHGCICGTSYYIPPSLWAAYNHKPYGHIQWPYSGLHAPFSGTLENHTTDVDGNIWFTDFFVNGTYLLRAYGKDAGFPINVGPGSYYLETAIYDNRGEYTMGTPKQIHVCGGPPPQVSPVYHEVSSGYVNVYWQNPQPNYVGAYLVEGGTYPGGTNVGSWNVGNTAAWAGLWVGPVGSGTYYVRVKAWNPCGFAIASPELTIVVP